MAKDINDPIVDTNNLKLNKLLNAANAKNKLSVPDCYIYLYHTDEYFILPQYPESLDDSLLSSFSSQNALGRTSPVFAYSNSGPRTLSVTLSLHRDMMNDLNTAAARISYKDNDSNIIESIGDDYIDLLAKKLQAIALPVYDGASAEINPPRIAIRFGNDVFMKGIVEGGIRVNYKLPLIQVTGVDGVKKQKYALVDLSFTVTETVPFDAESVGRLGSFRGLTAGLKTKVGM